MIWISFEVEICISFGIQNYLIIQRDTRKLEETILVVPKREIEQNYNGEHIESTSSWSRCAIPMFRSGTTN